MERFICGFRRRRVVRLRRRGGGSAGPDTRTPSVDLTPPSQSPISSEVDRRALPTLLPSESDGASVAGVSGNSPQPGRAVITYSDRTEAQQVLGRLDFVRGEMPIANAHTQTRLSLNNPVLALPSDWTPNANGGTVTTTLFAEEFQRLNTLFVNFWDVRDNPPVTVTGISCIPSEVFVGRHITQGRESYASNCNVAQQEIQTSLSLRYIGLQDELATGRLGKYGVGKDYTVLTVDRTTVMLVPQTECLNGECRSEAEFRPYYATLAAQYAVPNGNKLDCGAFCEEQDLTQERLTAQITATLEIATAGHTVEVLVLDAAFQAFGDNGIGAESTSVNLSVNDDGQTVVADGYAPLYSKTSKPSDERTISIHAGTFAYAGNECTDILPCNDIISGGYVSQTINSGTSTMYVINGHSATLTLDSQSVFRKTDLVSLGFASYITISVSNAQQYTVFVPHGVENCCVNPAGILSFGGYELSYEASVIMAESAQSLAESIPPKPKHYYTLETRDDDAWATGGDFAFNLRGVINSGAIQAGGFMFAGDDDMHNAHLEYRAAPLTLSGVRLFADAGYKRENGGETGTHYAKIMFAHSLFGESDSDSENAESNNREAAFDLYASAAIGKVHSEYYEDSELYGFAAGGFAKRIFGVYDEWHLRVRRPLSAREINPLMLGADVLFGGDDSQWRFGFDRDLEDGEFNAKANWRIVF